MRQTFKKFERQAGEKYFTPWCVTHAIAARVHFRRVVDPAAGAGHIVDAFDALGIPARGSDLNPDSAHIFTQDFFELADMSEEADLVSNPPYGIQGRTAVQFIEHALELTQPYQGKVAMLMQCDFDSAKTRRHLFDACPMFAAKYTLTDRIYWANLEHTERSSSNHAWYLWDWNNQGRIPRQHWLHAPAGGFR